MKNQRGLTLIELLVIISIVGFIILPISNLAVISLKTEKEVSIKNDIQREARFIMEYVSEEMRNSDITWDNYGDGAKKLINNNTSAELLEFKKSPDGRGVLIKDGVVLSENIKEFSVTDNAAVITIKLNVEKHGYEFELKSDIIHPAYHRYQ